jgi:hypothetical protein
MSCRHCHSKNQEAFEAELSACFPRMENLGQCPVYACQTALICLDCGSVDFKVPAAELQRIKEGLSSPTGPEHSDSGGFKLSS